MKHLALILSISLLLAASTNAAPVIFIVRHAEKATTGGKDPDLSVPGQKRADAGAYFEGFSDYFGVRYGIQAHTGNCGTNGKAAHVSPTMFRQMTLAHLSRNSVH